MLKIWIPACILMVVVGVWLIIDAQSGIDYAQKMNDGITIIGIGLFFFPFILLVIFVSQKINIKSMFLLSNETINVFEFDDNKFTIIQTKGDSYKSTTESDYSIFYKVIETNTLFLFYISNAACHVVPKKDIIEGTIEDLREVLINNLPEKKRKLLKH
ncbi:MAG: YcxB family protein [Bacteroidia bacterium]|nr:YcxB family protein [Bacteroidia bacterium]